MTFRRLLCLNTITKRREKKKCELFHGHLYLSLYNLYFFKSFYSFVPYSFGSGVVSGRVVSTKRVVGGTKPVMNAKNKK